MTLHLYFKSIIGSALAAVNLPRGVGFILVYCPFQEFILI